MANQLIIFWWTTSILPSVFAVEILARPGCLGSPRELEVNHLGCLSIH